MISRFRSFLNRLTLCLVFFPGSFMIFFNTYLCFIDVKFICDHHKLLSKSRFSYFYSSRAHWWSGSWEGVPGASGYLVLGVFDSLQATWLDWQCTLCLVGVWLSEWADCGRPQRLSDRLKLHDPNSRRGYQVSALWNWWGGVGLRLPRIFWIYLKNRQSE